MTRYPTIPRLFAFGALALVLALLAACGSTGATPTPASRAGTFAGAVPGTDAFVAIVVDRQNKALAYVCDSGQIGEWFRGAATADGSLDLTSAGGAHLSAKVAGQGASGTLTLAGKEVPFTAGPTQQPAGLYRQVAAGAGGQEISGWIVLPDGQERGTTRPEGNTGSGVRAAGPRPGSAQFINNNVGL
jgi:hypothetical protein